MRNETTRPARPLAALLVAAAALALSAAPLAAQAGVIVGEVVDAQTGRAVGGAVVQLDEYTRVVANGDGRFTLRRVRPGSYSAVVTRLGYNRQGERWTVVPRDTLRVTVRMTAEPVELTELRVRAARAFETQRDRTLNAFPRSARVFREEELEKSLSPSAADFIRNHGRLPTASCIPSTPRTGRSGPANCVSRRSGPLGARQVTQLQVTVDDRPSMGFAELETLPLHDIVRVEVIDNAIVRIYTRAFLEDAVRRGVIAIPEKI